MSTIFNSNVVHVNILGSMNLNNHKKIPYFRKTTTF